MAARLTRKEMKRDEILETATRFFTYITEHTRALILAVVAVLGLVLIGVGIFAYLEGRQTRANDALATALSVFNADIVDSGASPDDPVSPSFSSDGARDVRAQELMQEVVDDFGGGGIGNIARIYLGKLAVREGDLAAARDYWDEFLEGAGDHMLATEVRLNLLELDRAEGRGEEVLARLREQLGSGAADLPQEVVLDQLATTLERLGRLEEAKDTYQRLLDEYPASPYSTRAQTRLSSL